MSDETAVVRTQCEHGYHWEHYWEIPTTYGWRMPVKVIKCPGGPERTFRRAPRPLHKKFWVEVNA